MVLRHAGAMSLRYESNLQCVEPRLRDKDETITDVDQPSHVGCRCSTIGNTKQHQQISYTHKIKHHNIKHNRISNTRIHTLDRDMRTMDH